MKISTNILLVFVFTISLILSSCTPLLKKKSNTLTIISDELPQPKKVYKGFKIPSGPMDTEEVLIAQAKAAAISQAKRRAELLKQKKQKQNLTGEKSGMETIEQIEAKQARDAAQKTIERRARIKTNRLKVKTQREEEMLAQREAKRKKEADEQRRLKEAQKRQKEREDQLALEAKLAQDKKDEEARIARAAEEEKKRLLALQEKADKEKARRIAEEKKKATLAANAKKLKKEQSKTTIVNTNAKTKATKKKLVETGKEKALRVARETLALQREEQGYKPRATKKNYTTESVQKDNIKIVNTTKGGREKVSLSGAQPLTIGQPKVDFAEVPMTAVAPPKVSPGAKLPKDLVAAKRTVSKSRRYKVEAVQKIDIPSNTLKDFYFPIEHLENAKAYRYIAEGDFPDTTYWLMKALAFNGKTFLITETYDARFQLTQSVKEVVDENGVFMMDYTSFEVDGMGEINNVIAGVDDDESFKWNMSKGDKIAMGLNYNSSLYPNYDITTYRERTFVNESENVIFNGQALRTVMFEDKETAIFTDNKDEQETYASTYFNQYAEGVGLVKYVVNKNSKDNSEFKTYKLSKIMSYDEWQTITKPYQKR